MSGSRARMVLLLIAVAAPAAVGCRERCSDRKLQRARAASPRPVYLDPDRPLDERIRDLTARMTLDEKIAQLQNEAPEIPRLGVPAFPWWTEALHGVARAGRATVFPQAIALAATWDSALVHQVATTISDELRAKFHQHMRHPWLTPCLGLTVWSPNVNIFRDPRWGRGQETYGEDPYLSGRMAVSFVRGIQGDDPHYLKAIATPKHFAAHSGPEADRHHFAATVGARDLNETYLPAFEAAVTEGGAFSIMAAYNVLNGQACVASPALLGDVLRGSWGFRGYVVSDCDAVMDVFAGHRLTPSAPAAAALALRAGCDLNCGGTYSGLRQAIGDGLATEADVDRALGRLLEARFRLGLFDPPERVPWTSIPGSVVDSPAHRELARRTARESLVLLHNDEVLPLDPAVRDVAVIGPTADSVPVLLGNYNGRPSQAVTLLEGLRRGAPAGVRVHDEPGSDLTSGSARQRARAVALARRADAVVLVLGLTPQMEGEEGDPVLEFGRGDRETLELPAAQRELAQAIAALDRPTVVILTGGGPMVPPPLPRRGALLVAWYPGEEGGNAVADVVFGRSSPGGRLPVTFYRSVDDLPSFADYSMAGRTYRYLHSTPLYPFGAGMTTTTFRYSGLELDLDGPPGDAQAPASGATARVSVDLANTGPRPGDEVVQLYLRRPAAPAGPLRRLAGFQRVTLAPGEHRRITFTLGTRELAEVDDTGTRAVRPGPLRVEVGGGQPAADGRYQDGAGLTGDLELGTREPVQATAVSR